MAPAEQTHPCWSVAGGGQHHLPLGKCQHRGFHWDLSWEESSLHPKSKNLFSGSHLQLGQTTQQHRRRLELLADEFIELGDAACSWSSRMEGSSHTRELFSGTTLQQNICQPLHVNRALMAFQPSARPANPQHCWTQRAERCPRKGGRASTAGKGGTATTIMSCLLSHRCPTGIQTRHLFPVACSFPVATLKSLLCQMLIPGDMHHDFINHTCRATGLPLAPLWKSQVSPSHQHPPPVPHSLYLSELSMSWVTSSSRTPTCNCHCHHLTQSEAEVSLWRYDDIPNILFLKPAVRIFLSRLHI